MPFVYVGALNEAHAAERMIAARTPFIAPGHSLYLPFAGVVLGKASKRQVITKEHLGYCAQTILLGVLQKQLPQPLKVTDVLDILPWGKSTIFTAFHELEHFGFGKESTLSGSREKSFLFKWLGKELWDEAQEFLFNPCKWTVGLTALPPGLPVTIAGVDALAQVSMLNEQPPTVFAMELAAFRKQPVEIVPQDVAEIKLQLWLYDPCIWGKVKMDLLSLVLSLKNNPDERVQIAIESIIKEFP